ncbi:PKD domain-containing protein [Methanolobus sp. ZRKC2]|uniref:GLUG motif-containing protein n=1 Tax=Methanolobus sp. ZRKC2 TaxID=3125783 RepID=UPI003243E2CB
MKTMSQCFHSHKNNAHEFKSRSAILKISMLLLFCLLLSVPASAATYSGGSGTLADPYQLSTDSDIDTLSVTSADWGKNFTLTQNITLVGNHSSIGNSSIRFTGDFNGSGFIVNNLTVFQTTYDAGFFGCTDLGANIHDLGVEASSDGIVTTSDYVGVLVGKNYGTVNNSYATGNASGNHRVGGLIGYNYGTVNNSYATGTATGNEHVGGLVGQNSKTVSNSYATGNASGSHIVGGLAGYSGDTVRNSFATGTATGGSYVGGLVGFNDYTVSNSFATGTATGSSGVGGLVGYSSKTVSNSYYSGIPDNSIGITSSYANFTSFAFISGSSGLYWNASDNNITTADDPGFVWKIVDGYTHPYFQYQDTPAPLAPYVESISVSNGINNSDDSASFKLNVTGCSFNITDTVFVNLTMEGQTPINGTIDSITYTTINTTFNLTQAIACDWSLYVINPDSQNSIAKTFTVGSLFMPGIPETFTNTTGNFWVNHSWNAGTGDIADFYNVSHDLGWQNDTIKSFNHTGLAAHEWSNITVYAYNFTDSTLSAGVSNNVQIPNNAVTILNVTDIMVCEGETISFDINSTDADGDTPQFDCNRSSLFDSFNTSNGEGSWVTDLTDAGTYYIEFNVSDGYGSVDSQVMNITLNNVVTPVANFSASVTSGTAPLTVTFTDNSSNNPTAWSWDFGDGANSSHQSPIHTFNAVGTYDVSLNASNFAGSNLSSNMTITVTTVPSSGSSGSGGGDGRTGELHIRELDEPGESIGEGNTEEKSTKYVESVSFEAGSNGETLTDVAVWSSEETGYLSVGAGTKVTSASGGSVNNIRIVDILPATDVPEMEGAMAFQAYECTPDGTTFSPAISLTFTLSEEEWKQYGESTRVGWYNDDTDEWEIMKGTADAGSRTITIKVSHFSTYALFSDDIGEVVTGKTDKTGMQSSMSMLWLWIVLLLVIVGGAGYYVTQVKKKE